jgi:hypothetical protein
LATQEDYLAKIQCFSSIEFCVAQVKSFAFEQLYYVPLNHDDSTYRFKMFKGLATLSLKTEIQLQLNP